MTSFSSEEHRYDFFLERIFQRSLSDLPWRNTRNPYAIWVSEIFLQQTQALRVIPFYLHFLERFPDVFSLAAADWDDFLPFFRGLGFYSRGKNMLLTAKKIVTHFRGIFPETRAELMSLPGIGSYTAAALLTFAFGKKIPALDTNVLRICARFFPDIPPKIAAEHLVSRAPDPAFFHHALMDLGREICTSRNPRCSPCSLQSRCSFFLDQSSDIHSKNPSPTLPFQKGLIDVGVACIWHEGRYLIAHCSPEKGSWWEFPGGKRQPGEDWRTTVKREVWEEVGIEVSVRPHFYEELVDGYRLRFFRCQILSGVVISKEHEQLAWVSPKDFFQYSFRPSNARVMQKLQNMRM